MKKDERSAIIISASSDIGTAMSQRWLARGWNVSGTYRTKSQAVDELHNQGKTLIVVTHDDNIAKRAQRAIHLLDGQIERHEYNEKQ